MFQLILVLVVATLAVGAPQGKSLGRIVGGDKATIKQYPYQLSLLYEGSHVCGATLVGSKWAVTAAQCTHFGFDSSFSIRAGSSILNTGGEVIEVYRIYRNHQFNSTTTDYDVSVLELDEDVTVTNSAIIAMAPSESSVTTGATATITGWGTTSESGTAAVQLQVVQVPIKSQLACKSAYGVFAITDRMFCAGLTAGGKDACLGDTGGPLVVDDVLVGIVSWGYGCARPKYPTVYSNVASLRDFIDSVINK